MSTEDIRWEQRFTNYNKALTKLNQAVNKIRKNYLKDTFGNVYEDEFLDDIIKDGLIQRFKYTHELAWNVMKDYLTYKGVVDIYGSRDAAREAFSMGLIKDGEVWMDMIRSRNKTSQTYIEETADEIINMIMEKYISAFNVFEQKLEEIRSA